MAITVMWTKYTSGSTGRGDQDEKQTEEWARKVESQLWTMMIMAIMVDDCHDYDDDDGKKEHEKHIPHRLVAEYEEEQSRLERLSEKVLPDHFSDPNPNFPQARSWLSCQGSPLISFTN